MYNVLKYFPLEGCIEIPAMRWACPKSAMSVFLKNGGKKSEVASGFYLKKNKTKLEYHFATVLQGWCHGLMHIMSSAIRWQWRLHLATSGRGEAEFTCSSVHLMREFNTRLHYVFSCKMCRNVLLVCFNTQRALYFYNWSNGPWCIIEMNSFTGFFFLWNQSVQEVSMLLPKWILCQKLLTSN